jgi:hypothetical protein
MPKGVGYKAKGIKSKIRSGETKPGAVDDDATKRVKDRKKKLKAMLDAAGK